MPRKATKADKPALQFLERPVGGSRLQNVPEVRAAVNPKDFFSETQTRDFSEICSWVDPQFTSSAAAVPPRRRGRRQWQTTTNLHDQCSQLSRNNSTSKYPSLSFSVRSKDQLQQQPRARTTNKGGVSKVKNQAPQSVCRSRRSVLNGGYSDIPRKQFVKKRNAKKLSEGAASQIRSSERGCIIPAEGATTPASSKFISTEMNSDCPPPDLDTPEVPSKGEHYSSSSPGHIMFALPCTTPCSSPPDCLVADTPERDYGVKVTWRRRKGLMLKLKERGYLSESDALIHC
ncbi:PREDICTED: RAD9, HUS1, RAD1-interacting nuclear orphan protein 1 [Cyprinodon variegatus]|uniref:RAD9-HUS1-RAD1 interacting nuclear orphan 1 n=1 Tax=Cyprinodon variegatus TaxID=28743 RepID=A0A3Q2D6W6_CYPVA|nr:PREDICTED: RAD9, HUS1, RAD1-interacting nuclear orphan protein 1 [Cyprinodon variegatus]